MIVSYTGKIKVEQAITEAERKTSGDIVVVIAPASGTYYFVPLLWASVVALILPWPFIYYTWQPVQNIYALQLLAYLAVAGTLSVPRLRIALAPKSLKREAAHRRAVEQFLAQDMATTPSRTGVLLFISLAERYVEILADTAIHTKLPQGVWKTIVDRLTADIADADAEGGLVRAVTSIGEHLSAHFPAQRDSVHVLPNHLIVL